MDYDSLIRNAQKKVAGLYIRDSDKKWLLNKNIKYRIPEKIHFLYKKRFHKFINPYRSIEKEANLFKIRNFLQNSKVINNTNRIIQTYKNISFPKFIPPSINTYKIFSTPQSIRNLKKNYLYIHIPFCIKKCYFCGLYSIENENHSLIKDYIKALKKHLDMLIKIIPNKLDIAAVYLGGGTPTALKTDQLDDLLGYIKKRLKIPTNITYTVEASPKTIICKNGKDKLKVLLENGVNRLSIGVQSFDNSVLKLTGRDHNVNEAITSIKSAQKIGFDNINVDLSIGLPGQTTKTWYNTLKKVKESNSQSVSIYTTEWVKKLNQLHIYKMLKEKPDIIPHNRALLIMNFMAIKVLEKFKYSQIRPDFFIKKSRYLRNSKKNKQNPHLRTSSWWAIPQVNVLSLGAGSWSFYNDYHIRNKYNIPQYIYLINKNTLPFSYGIKISKKMKMKMNLITKIQFLDENGLNKKKFKEEFGLSPEEAFSKKLKELKEEGFILDKGDRFIMSFNGILSIKKIIKDICPNILNKI